MSQVVVMMLKLYISDHQCEFENSPSSSSVESIVIADDHDIPVDGHDIPVGGHDIPVDGHDISADMQEDHEMPCHPGCLHDSKRDFGNAQT